MAIVSSQVFLLFTSYGRLSSKKPKHVAELLILITNIQYIVVLLNE